MKRINKICSYLLVSLVFGVVSCSSNSSEDFSSALKSLDFASFYEINENYENNFKTTTLSKEKIDTDINDLYSKTSEINSCFDNRQVVYKDNTSGFYILHDLNTGKESIPFDYFSKSYGVYGASSSFNCYNELNNVETFSFPYYIGFLKHETSLEAYIYIANESDFFLASNFTINATEITNFNLTQNKPYFNKVDSYYYGHIVFTASRNNGDKFSYDFYLRASKNKDSISLINVNFTEVPEEAKRYETLLDKAPTLEGVYFSKLTGTDNFYSTSELINGSFEITCYNQNFVKQWSTSIEKEYSTLVALSNSKLLLMKQYYLPLEAHTDEKYFFDSSIVEDKKIIQKFLCLDLKTGGCTSLKLNYAIIKTDDDPYTPIFYNLKNNVSIGGFIQIHLLNNHLALPTNYNVIMTGGGKITHVIDGAYIKQKNDVIYKLNDNRYLIKNNDEIKALVDKNFVPIFSNKSITITDVNNSEEELIVKNLNNKYALADYNGKLISSSFTYDYLIYSGYNNKYIIKDESGYSLISSSGGSVGESLIDSTSTILTTVSGDSVLIKNNEDLFTWNLSTGNVLSLNNEASTYYRVNGNIDGLLYSYKYDGDNLLYIYSIYDYGFNVIDTYASVSEISISAYCYFNSYFAKPSTYHLYYGNIINPVVVRSFKGSNLVVK